MGIARDYEVTKMDAEAASLDADNDGHFDGHVTSPADENEERGNWGHQIDFFFSLLGYAVGLANVWRFPYMCMRNGGGVFLIPYFLFLCLAAVPMEFLELGLGQFSSLSTLKVWDACPLFSGIGWGMYIISYVVNAYFSIITVWIVYYLGMSFRDPLPWTNCDNDWNTVNCLEAQSNQTFQNTSSYMSDMGNTSEMTLNMSMNATVPKWMSPAEEFFNYNVLEISDGIENLGGIRWQLAVCNLVVWVINCLALIKGVKSAGKVVYVTATAPYLFLFILLVRGCTLPGSLNGIIYYLKPDFSKLLTFSIWSEACLQVFFSTGPGWGGLFTMASYNKFKHNVFRDAMVVPVLNGFTSLFAGFVVFSVIGHLAHQEGVQVDEMIRSGPSLAFIAYPEALAKLPFPPIWSVFFFIMLLTMGLDTQLILEETIVSGIKDTWPRFLRGSTEFITCLVILSHMLIGLLFCTRGGMYVFQIFDWYSCAVGCLLFSAMEGLVISYIYGFDRFFYDLKMMMGHTPCWAWRLLWGFVSPVSILICASYFLVLFRPPSYAGYEYPEWARVLGWCLTCLPLVPLPVFFLYRIVTAKGTVLQRLKSSAKPATTWGPALDKYRKLYKYSYDIDVPLKHVHHENNSLVGRKLSDIKE